MNRHTIVVMIVGVVLIGFAAATVYGFSAIGTRRRELVAHCKALRIGMDEQEIVTALGAPSRKTTIRQGPLMFERMFFAVSRMVPDVAAQPIFVDVDPLTRIAVRVICDEDFRLRSAEIEALERRGIH